MNEPQKSFGKMFFAFYRGTKTDIGLGFMPAVLRRAECLRYLDSGPSLEKN